MVEAKRKLWISLNIVLGYRKRFLLWLAIILLVTAAIDYLLGWRTFFLYRVAIHRWRFVHGDRGFVHHGVLVADAFVSIPVCVQHQ